jgi:hypothetical protein
MGQGRINPFQRKQNKVIMAQALIRTESEPVRLTKSKQGSFKMKIDSKLLASGLISALALAALGGCAGPAKMAQPAGQTMPAAQAPLEGKVVETMDAAGYTYICLEKAGKKTWVAVPVMAVKVGDELALQPGHEMGSFTSKALNRTFDKIIFSGGPAAKADAQSGPLPSGHPAIPAAAAPPADKAATVKENLAEKPFYKGKVVETMAASGYTYVCLEKDGKKSWAAVPTTAVNVGDEIEVQPGMEMGKFTSKTLNRTFDNIIFSPGIVPKK